MSTEKLRERALQVSEEPRFTWEVTVEACQLLRDLCAEIERLEKEAKEDEAAMLSAIDECGWREEDVADLLRKRLAARTKETNG